VFLNRLIEAFLQATNIARNVGQAIRRSAAEFAMGVILHLLAAALLLAAVLVLGTATFLGLKAIMPPAAALTIIGVILLALSAIACFLGRAMWRLPRR
jgi:ammonia channel protein AmtB